MNLLLAAWEVARGNVAVGTARRVVRYIFGEGVVCREEGEVESGVEPEYRR